jgi:Flp pilus assembly protein TadD
MIPQVGQDTKMVRKAEMHRVIGISLLFGLIIFSLTGCATFKKIINWVMFGNSSGKKNDISKFAETIRPVQGNPDSHYLLGCYYQERNKHIFAIEEFKKALLVEPDYLKAYNGLGISYDSIGEHALAIESYSKAIRLNPNLDYLHNNLGYSYLLQGDFDSAINAFREALVFNGENSRYHNNLALAYGKKGQYDLALSEFMKAGNKAKAYYNVAQIFYIRGLYTQAGIFYAKTLAIDPSMSDAHKGLAAAKNLAGISQTDIKESYDLSSYSYLLGDKTKNYQEREKLDTSAIVPHDGKPQKKTGVENSSKILLSQKSQVTKEDTRYMINVGAFSKIGYAERLKTKLLAKGYTVTLEKSGMNKSLHLVKVGPFSTMKKARAESARLETIEGLKAFITSPN